MDEIELRFSLLGRRNGTPQQAGLAAVMVMENGRPRERLSRHHPLLQQPCSAVRAAADAACQRRPRGGRVPADSGTADNCPSSCCSMARAWAIRLSRSQSISTSLTRRIESTDASCWSTTPPSPMQAAPVAAMKELITSGSASKLLLVFTHFDEVKGDNLPTRRQGAARPGLGRERPCLYRGGARSIRGASASRSPKGSLLLRRRHRRGPGCDEKDPQADHRSVAVSGGRH